MRYLAQKYSSLSPMTKYILWGVCGAVIWGGTMTAVFFWTERFSGNDPWKHFSYMLIVCVTLGAWLGASTWRKVERKIQERMRA